MIATTPESTASPPQESTANRTTANRTHAATRTRIFLLGLMLGAFGLRLLNFGGDSLWYDETFSAYLSAQPVGELIAHTARDIHPPGYYLLLFAWRSLSHPSVAFGLEYLLGWPSLFTGMVVLALTAALARRLFNPTTAILALALAALHPTEIWFAQEVRMYAPAAMLYLATLWVASDLLGLPRTDHSSRKRHAFSIGAYATLAAASLYVLYYSLFWLAALNLIALFDLWRRRSRTEGAPARWLLANALTLVLWLPWLPTFLRQAANPPVAPWREPWQTLSQRWAAATEAIAALLVGHTPPGVTNWPWAVLVGVLLISALIVAIRSRSRALHFILSMLVLPPLGLLLVSLVGPPIYFVRYIAPFAVLMPLVPAALLTRIDRRPAIIIAVAIILVQATTVRALWTNPRYASDDHRSAVADLAHAWRPGDAILVNAGWVYTAIATYWPDELPSPLAARPAGLARLPRLTAIAADAPLDLSEPIVIRTGTINGSSSLGWGLPESDFYPLSQQEATTGITTLAAEADRIWHYRLYDTVNDPTGLIRAALASNGNATLQQPYPGPSYLLLERYTTAPTTADQPEASPRVQFANGWMLRNREVTGTLAAGETIYATTTWVENGRDAAGEQPNMGLSLRLLDAAGTVYAQADTTLALSLEGSTQEVPHALPIPAATPPGVYTLVLLAYDPSTLQPIGPLSAMGDQHTPAIELSVLELTLPNTAPHLPHAIARFDYLELIGHAGLPAAVDPGGAFTLDLVWAARASAYQDNYTMELALLDQRDVPIHSWSVPLGTATYPSAAWVERLPVRRLVSLPVDSSLPPGDYVLALGIRRADDGRDIPRHNAWLPWVDGRVHLGPVSVQAKN